MSTATLKIVFNLLAITLATALAFGLCLGPALDDALFRQLALGRLIAGQGGFPSTDLFNFSLPASAGFDKQGWLFNLAAYGLYGFGSAKALALFRSALLMASFGLLVATGFRRQARPFSTLLFSLGALVALQPVTALSMGQAGFFFFALALYIMEGDFWNAFFARWIWLPVIMAVWINFHSAALLLIPLSIVWALSERGGDSLYKPELPGLALAGTLAAVAACALLNPSLAKIFFTAIPGAPDSPLEAGAFAAARPGLALLGLSATLLLASLALPGGSRHGLRDLIVLSGLALPALLWRGLLPYACLFAAPLAAARADLIIDALPAALRGARWIPKLALTAWAVSGMPRALAGFQAKSQAPSLQAPKETLDFFREEQLSGNVFNENAWAGRLLWDLDGQARLFTDGQRGAATDYARIWEAQPGWEKVLDHHAADFAWLRINSTLAKAMARSALWQPVDFDDSAVLYARVSPAHAALIKTWAPRGLRPGDLDEPFDASRLPQVEADLEARRLRRPQLGIIHYCEARLWKERGKESLARQWLEQGIKADPGYAPNYRLLGELRLKAGDKKGAASFFERAAALGGF